MTLGVVSRQNTEGASTQSNPLKFLLNRSALRPSATSLPFRSKTLSGLHEAYGGDTQVHNDAKHTAPVMQQGSRWGYGEAWRTHH